MASASEPADEEVDDRVGFSGERILAAAQDPVGGHFVERAEEQLRRERRVDAGAEHLPRLAVRDDVADAAARQRFLTAYDEAHEAKESDGRAVLIIGKDEYPFPIPIVADAGAWRFDTAAGAEEILDRRIGQNELSAIEVLKAYVDAQREYAEVDHDGKGVQYAQRLLSSEGKQDGLYWPTAESAPESPFGPLIAEAHAEGYRKTSDSPQPYHGYLFRVLTAQGANAAGGERDYVVNGRMLGGFGLIAVPAEYGSSGVKTFTVNQDGVVFEKDLGEETADEAAAIKSFDPDASWAKADG